MDTKRKEIVKHSFAVAILIIIIGIVISIVIKYQVNGETDMPYKLSKITVISTAEGEENAPIEGEENLKWNMSLNQNNDIYFFIDKSEESKKTKPIDSVTIQNIVTTKEPQKGKIISYMPNSGDGRIFVNNELFKIQEKLEFKGAKESNPKTLEVGSQGGRVLIRIANTKIGTYKSNDDTEIVHNGTLISKTETTKEEINFKMSLDFIITVEKIKYRANINLELPYGDILTDGTTEIEKTDMSDVVFKRM